MQTFVQQVKAGQPWVLVSLESFFQLVQASAPVALRFMQSGKVVAEAEEVEEGFFFKSAAWDRVEVRSDVDQIVKIIVSDGEAGTNRLAGRVRNEPVTANLLLNGQPVNVTSAGVVVAPVNAGRSVLRVLNAGAAFVALGAPGLEYENAVILLAPGEMWQEAAAPSAMWWAVTREGETSIIKIQEALIQ